MVKRRGPITDPWGTPHSSCCWRETTSPILIANVRSDEYEVSHASADSRIPMEYSCRSSILWSTVSKAAVRSRRTSITPFLRSSACSHDVVMDTDEGSFGAVTRPIRTLEWIEQHIFVDVAMEVCRDVPKSFHHSTGTDRDR